MMSLPNATAGHSSSGRGSPLRKGGGLAGAKGEYPHCPSIGRWIVERTFGWLSRNRRLARGLERKVQTSETLIELAMIRLLLRRLA
jgi:hypothetical protein